MKSPLTGLMKELRRSANEEMKMREREKCGRLRFISEQSERLHGGSAAASCLRSKRFIDFLLSLRFESKDAFDKYYGKKYRTESVGDTIDNLLDPQITNPPVTSPEAVDENLRIMHERNHPDFE